MPKPKGMTKREWLRSGWPDDAYFSYDYGGIDDDQFYWYFKRASRSMLQEVFEELKNGGAMEDYRIEEHRQPFTVNAISHGWRVYPVNVDFAFMDMDSINQLLISFFASRQVELTLLSHHRLLNLKPKW